MNPVELQNLLTAPPSNSMLEPSAGKKWIPEAQVVADVAVVWVRGILGKHAPWWAENLYDLARLETAVLAIMGSEEISTVVIVGHSPGGDSVSGHDAALLVDELAQAKRVVGFVDNCSCSAMYQIHSACGELYSTPFGISGNIGSKIAIEDVSRLWEQEGRKKELIASGSLKSPGESGLSLTDDQRVFLEAQVATMSSSFFDFVSARRPVDESVFNGGWFAAPEAESLGLIDGTYLTLAHLVSELID